MHSRLLLEGRRERAPGLRAERKKQVQESKTGNLILDSSDDLPCPLFFSMLLLCTWQNSSQAYWCWHFLFSMSPENISGVSIERVPFPEALLEKSPVLRDPHVLTSHMTSPIHLGNSSSHFLCTEGPWALLRCTSAQRPLSSWCLSLLGSVIPIPKPTAGFLRP